jgi:Transmembrane amino acid transporter protein
MSYMNMEPWLYNSVTLGVFACNVALACVIESVTIVFGFIAAFAISTIVFTLPGIFYILSYRKYQPAEDKVRYAMAAFYIIIGVLLMIFLLIVQILTIVNS